MRTIYRPLFRVRLRHSFYPAGSSTGDFVVTPAPATARALASHGLVFRRLADGWAVYGEVEPDSSPQRLLRPLGADGLVFLLRPANPHLWTISELPEYRPGRGVFYFNNLRDDQADGRRHLGDSVAGARVGAAVPLLAGESVTYDFTAPVHAATLTIRDLFGHVVATETFSLPDAAATTSEFRLDLAGAQLVPGRYAVSDEHGGSLAFYYDPEISRRPFGVVEIFSGDPVPVAYRFLDGDELTGAGEYALQLESRATSWRFNVIKKYGANGFALADLSIAGPVAFTKTLGADRVIFTSAAAVALSAGRRALVLMQNSNEIRDLPNPGAATPLAAGAVPGGFVSEMYVYV